MYSISKINCRGPSRQRHEFTLRCKAEYFILIHSQFGMFQKLLRVMCMIENFKKFPDPAVLRTFSIFSFLFILPVRRHPDFSFLVHIMGTNLNLKFILMRANHRCMDGAVKILFRQRDIIFKAAQHHRPFAVHNTERTVTSGNIIHHNTERHHIRKLLKTDILPLHFPPDGIWAFNSAANLGFNTVFFQKFGKRGYHIGFEVRAFFNQIMKSRIDRLHCFRIHMRKGKMLKLILKLMHTDTFRKWCVYIKCFLGNPFAFLNFLNMPQRAHIVHTVSKFNQQHADIIRHCKQELPEVLCLPHALSLHFDFRKLGYTIYQFSNLGAKELVDFFYGCNRILYHIMEKRRGNGIAIQFHIRQDACHLKGMREIRISRRPCLATMSFHRKYIGTVKESLIHVFIVGSYKIN